jgi:hypothetical protein
MPDISTPNLDYDDMVEAWDINDALMGGTLEMRRQGRYISRNGLTKIQKDISSAFPLRRCSHLMKRALSRISVAFSLSRRY